MEAASRGTGNKPQDGTRTKRAAIKLLVVLCRRLTFRLAPAEVDVSDGRRGEVEQLADAGLVGDFVEEVVDRGVGLVAREVLLDDAVDAALEQDVVVARNHADLQRAQRGRELTDMYEGRMKSLHAIILTCMRA